MSGDMDFGFSFSQPSSSGAPRREEGTPFRMLVMGDFSGRESRLATNRDTDVDDPIIARRAIQVDIDNFESVLAKMAPRICLTLGAAAQTDLEISFESLDDFHPDRLFERLPLFQQLKDTRRRLLDPNTFAETAAELNLPVPEPNARDANRSPAAAIEDANGQQESDNDTFDRLLGGAARTESAGAKVDISAFVQSIMQPHIAPSADPRQEEMVRGVDMALAEQMRTVLHHPQFQALESRWRGVARLLENLDWGDEMKLFLLDVSKPELVADFTAHNEEPNGADIYKAVVERHVLTPAGQPWSVLVGDYSFGLTHLQDPVLAGLLGGLGSQAGGPFIGSAEPELVGCHSFATDTDSTAWHGGMDGNEVWKMLRKNPLARWVGLAAPRVLMRLPYGKQTDEVDCFDFEELISANDSDSFLWGSPAMACGLLLGQAFQSSGWQMQPGDELELDDLPAHAYVSDGESKITPCAEGLLSERAGEKMLACGIMPLLSYKNRNAARLLRFQSLAEPLTPLAFGRDA